MIRERALYSSSVADDCSVRFEGGCRIVGTLFEPVLFMYARFTAVGDQGTWTQFAKRRQKTKITGEGHE